MKREKHWKEQFKNARWGEYPARLNLRGLRLDDEGLRYVLKFIKGVNQLDLDENEISNESLQLLSPLEYVNELRLKDNAQLDDICIPFLANLKELSLLHLHGTSVTAKGAIALRSSPSLRTLFLSHHSSNTDADWNKLKDSLPQCRIIVDHREIHPSGG